MRPSPAKAAWLSLVGLKDVTWGVFYGFYLIAKDPSIATGDQGAMGVVGIVDVSGQAAVSYTPLRAHETVLELVCRLLLENKNKSDEQPT